MAQLPALTEAPGREALDLLVKQAFDTKILSVEPAGTGMLGYVSKVELADAPHKLVIKCQKYNGRAEPETAQLNMLRGLADTRIPEVFHVHKATPELPFEAMLMELLPGVQASSLKDPSMEVQEQIAEEAIDLLLQWHSVGRPEGYGLYGAPPHRFWHSFMHEYWSSCLAGILQDNNKESLPPIILEMADRSLEAIEEILGRVEGTAVLTHGDYWLPNILIDPETYHITGIVDPQHTRWDEREADVVPMDWPWGDYQFLMNAYQRRFPLREGWPLRFAFHRFWFMMQALFLLGPGPAAGEAETLKKMMDEQVG